MYSLQVDGCAQYRGVALLRTQTAACALLVFVTVACHGPVNTEQEQQQQAAQVEPVRYGSVQVALTDSPIDDANVTAVNVCIERVDFIFAGEQPRGTLLVDRTIDLLELQDGVSVGLGIARLPVGRIQMVRLVLCPDGASVVIDGVEVPVKVPSGEQTGIKLTFPGGFEIRENVATTIILDFDAERSLHFAPGQGWMLTPVVQIVEQAILLTVTSPQPGDSVGSTVLVEGTVASREPLAELAVNDLAASVDGLDWQVEITLPDGQNTITARAVDILGRSAVVSFDITADGRPPTITIVSPADEAFSSSPLQINVTLEDDIAGVDTSSIEVLVGGSDISAGLSISDTAITGLLDLPSGVHIMRVEASDRAGNRGSRAATLIVDFVAPSPRAELHLQQLEASQSIALPSGNAVNTLGSQLRKDGSLAFIHGIDLAPDCLLDIGAGSAGLKSVVQCFLDSHTVLFEVGGELPTADSWDVVHDAGIPDFGFIFLEVAQRVDELPVQEGDATVILHDRKVVAFAGRLFTPSRLPLSLDGLEAPSPAVAREAAEAAVGSGLRLRRRYFDAYRHVVISEFDVTGTAGDVVVFDEANLVVVNLENRALLGQVAKTATIGRYGDSTFQFALEPFDKSQTATVLVDQQPQSGNQCVHALDAGNGAGAPRVIDDRDLNGIGPTYSETNACDEQFFMYYDGVNYDNRDYDGPQSPLGTLMNVYFWARDISQFLNAESSMYVDDPMAWLAPSPVDVFVGPSCRGGYACADNTSPPHIRLPRTRAPSLHDLAHEYGHIAMYLLVDDTPSAADPRGRSLAEGFGDHNKARYAMHRFRQNSQRDFDNLANLVDPYLRFNLGPEEGTYVAGQSSHRVLTVEGESLPVPSDSDHPFYDDQADGLFYSKDSPVCLIADFTTRPRFTLGPRFEEYSCGSVVPVVYWELAWNQCRVSYDRFSGAGACVQDQPILMGALAAAPEAVAGAAFTIAMKGTHFPSNSELNDVGFASANDPVSHFLDLVALTYGLLSVFGDDLSGEELERVFSVLNHHCVGPAHHCNDYHRLPASHLPMAFTHKASFDEGNSRHLLVATSMGSTGSPWKLWYPTGESVGFVKLDSSDDEISAVVDFPSTSFYSFFGSVRSQAHICSESEAFYLGIDDQPLRRWDIKEPCTGQFAWDHSQANIHIGAGPHTVRVKYNSGVTEIEALRIEQTNCPPTPSCSGRCGRIDDDCGGLIDCGGCFASVSADGHHSCAVNFDATVSCWGRNHLGQLGDNLANPDGSSIPVQVVEASGSTLQDVVGVSNGGDFTCAVTGGGGVYCWGSNWKGRLGLGFDEDLVPEVPVATQLGGLSDAVSVAAGGMHACSLLTERCGAGDTTGADNSEMAPTTIRRVLCKSST